jgi:hypothetical protein
MPVPRTSTKQRETKVAEQPASIIITHELDAVVHEVWKALISPEGYTSEEASVRHVELSHFEADCREVCWTVWIKGFELRWRELQRADHILHRLEFEQQQGMLSVYRGRWELSASPGRRTDVVLSIELDTGLPYLAKVINPVIAGAFAIFAQELVEALEGTVARSLSADTQLPRRKDRPKVRLNGASG